MFLVMALKIEDQTKPTTREAPSSNLFLLGDRYNSVRHSLQ